MAAITAKYITGEKSVAQMTGPAPEFVREVDQPLQAPPQFDVVMCGGTLGIFLACALQLSGLRYWCLQILPLPTKDLLPPTNVAKKRSGFWGRSL